MATLVLTAVGTIVGGPIGGTIGGLLGAGLDRAIAGSGAKGRQGPRLGDLAVQTSSYGSELPRLFGTMRVAGTVIWATDLREERHSARSGGKGGGSVTSYSYSCSFAVALSARPIRRIGRIWADGKLLRGAAGDWKSVVAGFRLHPGDEAQAPDPLIAAAEGIGRAPAHRGLAYAVFEGLELADFGNRIPSLAFEVEADAGPVGVAAIAEALSDGAIRAGAPGPTLDGFAAKGDSVRAVLDVLAAAVPLPLTDDGQVLRTGESAAVALPAAALGARTRSQREPATVRTRRGAETLPDQVSLSYYAPERDYQAGLQRARRDGIGRRDRAIDLPAALAAPAARALAEAALARAWIEREQATARVSWAGLGTHAGGRVAIEGAGGWRVTGWTLERMVVELALVRDGAPSLPAGPSDPGRAAGDGDVPAGATTLVLLDLPAFDDAPATAPCVWAAAAGTGAGWRRAELSLSLDAGASIVGVAATAAAATIGTARSALAAGTTTLFDRTGTVEVELLADGMTLAAADDAALVAGANLAMLGAELLQFGRADQIGPRRFRLSGLLRGRRGSEAAVGTHRPGERFVLLDPATLRALPVPASAVGATAAVSALGVGDGGVPALATIAVEGAALRPPAPIDLRLERAAGGRVRLGWTRRSRLGWAWLDGGDAPLGEDAERYTVELRSATALLATRTTMEPALDYDPAGDGLGAGAELIVAVAMLGTRAASPPVRARFTI